MRSWKRKLCVVGAMIAATVSFGAAGQAVMDLADGVVRKVDKDARKITIRHGEIRHLDMPPMTMVFQVKDPAMLEQVQPGEKVQFRVEKSGGAMVLTEIRPVR